MRLEPPPRWLINVRRRRHTVYHYLHSVPKPTSYTVHCIAMLYYFRALLWRRECATHFPWTTVFILLSSALCPTLSLALSLSTLVHWIRFSILPLGLGGGCHCIIEGVDCNWFLLSECVTTVYLIETDSKDLGKPCRETEGVPIVDLCLFRLYTFFLSFFGGKMSFFHWIIPTAMPESWWIGRGSHKHSCIIHTFMQMSIHSARQFCFTAVHHVYAELQGHPCTNHIKLAASSIVIHSPYHSLTWYPPLPPIGFGACVLVA